MDIEIVWEDRYSSSDKPDDMGRWARVGYLLKKRDRDEHNPFHRIQIAWINKIGNGFCAYVYIGNGKHRNQMDTLEEAKSFCKQIIIEFNEDYLK